MIAKAVDGYRPAGLLRYLFGPGTHEEHRDPRVVGSWDGAPWLHHPDKPAAVHVGGQVRAPGEFDFDLGPLTETMQELAAAAGLPLSNPPAMTPEWAAVLRSGPRRPAGAPSWLRYYRFDAKKNVVELRPGYVWHCPVRLHPSDPTLTDAQWELIATRLMKATGIHQAGCRWVAVRHADDHIHLMAVLVSERTGKRFYPYQDYPKLEKERNKLEDELGLYSTAKADKTALREPTRAELGKAERLGRPMNPARNRPLTAREELRRVVSQCAAAAVDGRQFLALLKAEGLAPKTSHDAQGLVRGYTVALPGDVTADGVAVPYSGGSLASDLTWPKLMARWASTPPVTDPVRLEDGRVGPVQRRGILDDATEVVGRAVGAVGAGTEDPDGIAHGAGELLVALGRGREGRESGTWSDIVERYDRAARTPHRVLPARIGPIARDLRHAARRVAMAGALTGRGHEKLALVTLVLALAALVAEIAAWQEQRGRLHQAAAARTAAAALPGATARPTGARRPPSRQGGPSAAVRQERPVARRDDAEVRAQRRGKSPG